MDDPPLPPAACGAADLAWGDVWISILWVVGLLAVNAFFVAVEFSLVSTRHSRMTQLASEGNLQAQRVRYAQDRLERSLSTTQLGITVASVSLGWIGATQTVQSVCKGLAWLRLDQVTGSQGLELISLGLTFGILTYLQLVWGELLPKTLAIVYAEPIALRLVWFNSLLSRILTPIAEWPRITSRLILKAFGVPVRESSSLYSTLTAEELQLLIASSSGGIEAEERELLTNVIEFGETVASEVMIPRTSVEAVSIGATVNDVLQEVASSRHSRYPVYEESLDHIRGILDIKALMAGLAEGRLTFESGIEDSIQPAHFEHENKLIAELLPEMQQHHRSMIVVVDEFGGTAGLITIKDIVEEIVGTLSDDPNQVDDEPDVEIIDDYTLILQAQLSIEHLREKLGLDIPLHDDYQTLGGFLIYQLQKIPKIGEKLVFEGLELQVIRAEGPRLDRIKVIRDPAVVASLDPSDDLRLSQRVGV